MSAGMGGSMARATTPFASRLGRRRLLQGVGGGAALATLGLPAFTVSGRAQDELTITMWNNHPEWRDRMLEMLAAFEETNAGIAVELTGIPGQDYRTKLLTAIAGGATSDALGMEEGMILTQ